MAKNLRIRKRILRITNNFFGSLTDFILFSCAYGLSISPGKTSYLEDGGAGEAADTFLAKVNYRSIKNALYDLRRKGFITYLKRETFLRPQITNEGRQKIKKLLPVYNSKRSWDKRIYLVSYDIPANKNQQRNELRNFLKQLRCGYLQHSVWLTVYNPKTLVKEFVKENNIPGQILISDLGPDGNVGEKDIKTLLEQVYQLSDINYQYQCFIKDFKKAGSNLKQQIVFQFLSILNEDPQLPFELLPDDWVGDEAYELVKTYC